MAEFFGVEAQTAIAAEYQGRVAAAHQQAPQSPYSPIVDDTSAYAPDYPAGTFSDVGEKSSFASSEYEGFVGELAAMGCDWFERFHVLPRQIAIGNVLSEQTAEVTTHSGYRRTEYDWTDFVNNAGSGISLSGAPSLPATMKPQSGYVFDVVVAVDGPASVDSTLEFHFSDPSIIVIPITLERIVLFVPEPELPMMEILEFLTGTIEGRDGSEQRQSYRKNPRQFFKWEQFLEDDGAERARMHNILSSWLTRTFGVPAWHDMTILTSAVTAGATSLPVQIADYSDFRVSGLVLVYSTPRLFDVLTIDSVASTTIGLTAPLENGYAAGSAVAPVRRGVTDGSMSGERFPANLASLSPRFRILDNDIDIADTSAFSSYDGKVLIDGHNGVRGRLAEEFRQRLNTVENPSGVTYQTSPWEGNKRTHPLTLYALGRQALWEVRQLLHALRGRQVAFYVCSFSKDFLLLDDLASGTATMSVRNVGYARFVQERQPRNVIRVVFNDGTSPLLREIIASGEIDSDEEQLTVDSNWPSNYAKESIDRIEYVERVRFASDRIRIDHRPGSRIARVTAPVVSDFNT